MKKKFTLSQYRIYLLMLIFLFSCKKFTTVDNPDNQVDSKIVFTNDATATAAVLGVYLQMVKFNNYFMNGGLTLYPGLSADEFYNTASSATYDPFTTNQIQPTSSVVSNDLWRYGYAFIYQANACIEGLEGADNLTPATKNQLLGEVYFMRAILHFNMTNLFGGIPLSLTTNYRTNEILPRTPVSAVYDQVVKDLITAKSLLVAAYPSAGQVRANKWAASALLARVYLYRSDWANAETEASSVIASGAYTMETNLNNVFLATSKETILAFIPTATSTNTAEGATFIPASATVIPDFAVTNTLLNAFESTDQRKTAWLKSNTVNSKVYYYPYKYKVKSSTTVTENNVVLKLDEQYLIRAEARAQQNKVTGANSAESDVDVIRNRAGLPNTTSATQATMLLAIEKERQTELFAEWGHRWFDLKRTGRINTVLAANKTGWNANAALYPIPYSELMTNPFLTQNQGY